MCIHVYMFLQCIQLFHILWEKDPYTFHATYSRPSIFCGSHSQRNWETELMYSECIYSFDSRLSLPQVNGVMYSRFHTYFGKSSTHNAKESHTMLP